MKSIEDSIILVKKFYEEMEKVREGEETLTPEMHRDHVDQILPGFLELIERAGKEGKILYIRAQSDVEQVPKEKSEDGIAHTYFKDQMAFLFIIQTEKKQIK